MAGRDSYVEGTPLHAVYESKESRVIAALLSEGGDPVEEDKLEALSGVPNVRPVVDELAEQALVTQGEDGYRIRTNHPHAEELYELENQLMRASHIDRFE